jgi:hypothetical protein
MNGVGRLSSNVPCIDYDLLLNLLLQWNLLWTGVVCAADVGGVYCNSSYYQQLDERRL